MASRRAIARGIILALLASVAVAHEQNVEEYYGADAAKQEPPTAAAPKEVSEAVAAYNRLNLPTNDPNHPNYFEHIPPKWQDWKDLRGFVEFGAWGIKEMTEDLDRWKDPQWQSLLADFEAGYSKLEMMPLEFEGVQDVRKAPTRVVSFVNVRVFRVEDVGDGSPGAGDKYLTIRALAPGKEGDDIHGSPGWKLPNQRLLVGENPETSARRALSQILGATDHSISGVMQMPWARMAHGVVDLELVSVVSTHPNLQLGLMTEAQAEIAPGVPLCPGDDVYTGLSCVMQIFIFNAVVSDLPSPDEPMYDTRTKEGDVVSWDWETWNAGAGSDCERRRLHEVTDEASWYAAWGQRISCWFEETPLQDSLRHCSVALGLHLAARFDAALQAGGQSAPQAALAGAQPERGCEWIMKGGLDLPAFPDFGKVNIELPDLPKLLPSMLPWGVQKWNELGEVGEQSRAPAATQGSSETAHVAIGAAVGGTLGALAVLGVSAGSKSLRRKADAQRAQQLSARSSSASAVQIISQ